ncbi:MAG: hypothetical protein GY711_31390 [bacterium]|nr:hypothetical protein [bacterium]
MDPRWIYPAVGVALVVAGFCVRPKIAKVALFVPGFWILFVLTPTLF